MYLQVLKVERRKIIPRSTRVERMVVGTGIDMSNFDFYPLPNLRTKDENLVHALVYIYQMNKMFENMMQPDLVFKYITKTRLFKFIENLITKNWKISDKKLWYFSYFCS